MFLLLYNDLRGMRKVAQKLHGGLGGWSSGPCKHRFQYLIPVYLLLRYPGYDWSILGQFTSALTSSSGFTCAESTTDMSCKRVKPPFTAPFDIFDTRNGLQEMGGGDSGWIEVFKKC